MRTPSEKTQLKQALRTIKELKQSLARAETDYFRFRTRASNAEQELAEWKARFDKLLEFRRDNGGAA